MPTRSDPRRAVDVFGPVVDEEARGRIGVERCGDGAVRRGSRLGDDDHRRRERGVHEIREAQRGEGAAQIEQREVRWCPN